MDAKRYEEALVAYEQALHVESDNIDACRCKGFALYILGRYEEALGAYEQAIGLDPWGHDAYWYKSRILEQLRRTGEARRAHPKARQILCRELY